MIGCIRFGFGILLCWGCWMLVLASGYRFVCICLVGFVRGVVGFLTWCLILRVVFAGCF